ncbi:MAG: cobaltochelatase subunit CobN, partial [Pseudomonadaceae bacterium]|nr:cobaltochelatase subunit CobN [Pseudomonadaceae bacterium]
LLDKDTRDFIQTHNPGALQDILERLLEAQQRGLWQNPGEYQTTLENLLLDSEEA